MKFRVKAVLPEGEEPMEAEEVRKILLPPAKAMSYGWVYITAIVMALAGLTIGRLRKHRRKKR